MRHPPLFSRYLLLLVSIGPEEDKECEEEGCNHDPGDQLGQVEEISGFHVPTERKREVVACANLVEY